MVDFARRSRRCASGTTPIGKNGWRLEEFQHYWGNATFDDAGTAEAAKFLLRLYVEKRDPKYKPALDKAIAVRARQPVPDRRLAAALSAAARVRASTASPTTRRIPTFNDDVAAENIDFLLHVLPGARRRPAARRRSRAA